MPGTRGEKIDNLIIVLATCGSDAEAKKLSDGLVGNNLAACVNIADVGSVFKWQGKLEDEKERLLIIKSLRSKFSEIERFIKNNHSYDCPEIIAMEVVAASEEYADWIRSSCKPD